MLHEVKQILEKFNSGYDCIFITGRAGTGKSTLLKNFVVEVGEKIAVTAPTGVAALNVYGETLHSFFRIKPGISIEAAKIEAVKMEKTARAAVYKNLQYLIIDEISMVRADLLDCIDMILRTIRKKDIEFGGVKVLMFGDLLQLPPVVENTEKDLLYSKYESEYFFSSEVIGDLLNSMFPRFGIIELMKVHRQTDQDFIEILNNIRQNTVSISDLKNLNQRVSEEIDLEKRIALISKNYKVEQINKHHLELIDSNSKFFYSQKNGAFDIRLNPAPEILELKKGAKVMFCVNDSEDRFVNGQIGVIVDFFNLPVEDSTSEDTIIPGVLIESENKIIELTAYTWEISKVTFNKATNNLDREIVGTFTQLPLQFAWAITIHKSQGKTFDKVHIDLTGGAFAHGQTYVALSRCRTLEGITLSAPIKLSDIIVDERIVKFFQNVKILNI